MRLVNGRFIFRTIIGFLLVIDGIKGILAQSLEKTSLVKTITTEYGDIYDCIDFYKQPAFQHSALKNHSFYPQMRPSSRPKWRVSRKRNIKEEYEIGFKDGGCPSNTVPIRRMSDEDLSRANALSKEIYSSRMHTNGIEVAPGTHRAILQSRSRPTTATYYGVGGTFSIWNPPTEAYQYSSAQFLIQNGLDSIQFGWTVNPTLYKDNKTHMFIHTTTGGGSHCFNTLCPGFVIVRSDIPPDAVIKGYSVLGKNIRMYDWFVYQNGNWWLEVGTESSPIGFWPKDIFSGLAHFGGSYMAAGGETYNPEKPGGPPMGTGKYILGSGSFKWDAYCSHFVAMHESHDIKDADDTEEFSDSDKYQVRDGWTGERGRGRFFFFGGPGE